ncbi:MAG: hypothetical protein M3O88_03245 [Actinomycetota bacterium]|nr:hypothetical protein [Actinomycetota bacterium]
MKTLRLFGLGVRLSLAGGRSSVVRLLLMSIGVAVGVALLIGALSVGPAISARRDREAARRGVHLKAVYLGGRSATYEWNLPTTFEGTDVMAIAVRGVGSDPPVPPGLPRLPSPGEVYASPVLAQMLAGPDGALLRPRLPGRLVGTISRDGLIYPGEVVGYVGAPRVLRPSPGDPPVIAFDRQPAPQPALDLGKLVLLSVILTALLLPIGLFVLTTTRLSASTREARYAAVRLAGATQRQVNLLAAAESAVGAAIGCVLALPLFILGRSMVSRISILGVRWFASDFTPPPVGVVGLLVGVPLFAVLVTTITMRGIVVSPLGIVRRVRRMRRGGRWPPVLAAGFALLALAAARHTAVMNYPSPIPGIIIGGGLMLILLGLTGTAPWLGWLSARWIAGRSPTPSVLLGARGLEAEPTSAGRVVSGVAVLIALVGVMQAFALWQVRDSAGVGINVAAWAERSPATSMVASVYDGRDHAGDFSTLDGVSGVRTVKITHKLTDGGTNSNYETAVLGTNGSTRTLEEVRNALAWVPYATVQTVPSIRDAVSPYVTEALQVERLIQGIAILLLGVTGASLLVSTVDGMMERRRVLAALSATGVSTGVLRRSVLVQIALPLFAALALGIAGALAVTSLLFRAMEIPAVLPVAQLLITASAVGILVLLVTAGSVPWAGVVRKPELLRTE